MEKLTQKLFKFTDKTLDDLETVRLDLADRNPDRHVTESEVIRSLLRREAERISKKTSKKT
jgi:hypothetical protein